MAGGDDRNHRVLRCPRGTSAHDLYSATPEYGKEKFHAKFRREVERVKAAYPNVPYIGLGDGCRTTGATWSR